MTNLHDVIYLQDEPLYVTSLTAGEIFAGYTLLALVMNQKHQTAQNPDQK